MRARKAPPPAVAPAPLCWLPRDGAGEYRSACGRYVVWLQESGPRTDPSRSYAASRTGTRYAAGGGPASWLCRTAGSVREAKRLCEADAGGTRKDPGVLPRRRERPLPPAWPPSDPAAEARRLREPPDEVEVRACPRCGAVSLSRYGAGEPYPPPDPPCPPSCPRHASGEPPLCLRYTRVWSAPWRHDGGRRSPMAKVEEHAYYTRTVFLTRAQDEGLKAEALRRGMSVRALVRLYVDAGLAGAQAVSHLSSSGTPEDDARPPAALPAYAAPFRSP